MRILGVDPGTNLLGLGLIDEVNHGNGFTLVEMRILDLKKIERKKVGAIILKEVSEFIEEYKPDCMAIEDQFIGINLRSGLKVNEAKMSAILAAQLASLPYYEYSPTTVKKSATGNGNADKEYVATIVCGILEITKKPEYYDVTDALAVAICHANRRYLKEMNYV